MAIVYKRASVYWGRYQVNGRSIRKSLGTGDKAVALDRLRKLIEEQRDVTKWGGKPRMTFGDAAIRFRAEHYPKLKPKTRGRYDTSLMVLAPKFEDMLLADIGTASILEFEVDRRAAGVTDATIIRDIRLLGVIFEDAIAWGAVDASPVPLYMKRSDLRDSQPKTRYLSHEEERQLLEKSPPWWRDLFIIAIDTGLRSDELRLLEWAEINFDKEQIALGADRTKARRFRAVPILERSLRVLRRMKSNSTSRYVFSVGERNEPYADLGHPSKKVIERAGIVDCSIHDLRRTCGCRLLQDYNLSIERVSHYLGHASVAVTQRHYAFLTVDAVQKSIRAANPTRQVNDIGGTDIDG